MTVWAAMFKVNKNIGLPREGRNSGLGFVLGTLKNDSLYL